MGYRVIMMVSGPHVVDLLLAAKRLDLLFVTQAQVEIPFEVPASVQTMGQASLIFFRATFGEAAQFPIGRATVPLDHVRHFIFDTCSSSLLL
jgi:hypothetical protein